MSKPTVIGVSRMFDNKCAALIFFDREPTDDELRDMHETLRAERFGQAEPVTESVLCWVNEDELPESLTEAAYDALFPYSRVDVVRLFPVFAAPLPVKEKRWPFVETPGEFTERLRFAMIERKDLLPPVRNVLIENPPTLAAPHPDCVAELERENAELRQWLVNKSFEVSELRRERDALAEQVDRLTKDAERYQYIRDHSRQEMYDEGVDLEWYGPAVNLDAAIDAALAARADGAQTEGGDV